MANQSAETIYLTVEDVFGRYGTIFECSLQEASYQLRTRSGVESPLARPEFFAYYEGADLAKQAAILAHGIAESQCFVEGNKRTAGLVMLTFLAIKGSPLTMSPREFFGRILQLDRDGAVDRLAEAIRVSSEYVR